MGRIAESALGGGEKPLGFCLGTRNATFTGRPVMVVVASDRLVILDISEKDLAGGGTPRTVTVMPDEIADFSTGMGGGPYIPPLLGNVLVDSSAINIRFRTANRLRFQVATIRGPGDGSYASLGGQEIQNKGVFALAEWLEQRVGRSGPLA